MNQPTTPNTVEDFVNDYEWRTDEFCHTPTDRERDMLRDFAVLLADEGILADRAQRTPAAPVVAEGLTDIPNGVYYSDEADNFYSMMSKQGMGRDFHMEWRECKHLFPQSDWKADAKAKRAAHPVAGSPAETCHCNNPIKQCNDKRPGCKVVAHMRNAAAAEPMPASEAASLYEIQRDAAEQAVCANLVNLGLISPDRLAAPAAPTDALPYNWMVREAVNRKRGAVTNMISDAAVGEIMSAVRDLMPSRPTAAQSVRDAAQPAIAPGDVRDAQRALRNIVVTVEQDHARGGNLALLIDDNIATIDKFVASTIAPKD